MTTRRLLEDTAIRLLEDGAARLTEEVEGGIVVPPPVITRTAPDTDAILNLKVGVRADRFEFDLLDRAHNKIGELDVTENSAPHVVWDGTRAIQRTCTGLTVPGKTFPDVDVRRDRVRPVLVLENQAKFNLGVFAIGEDNRDTTVWGGIWMPNLFDENQVLNQPLSATASVAPGGSLLGLYLALVEEVGLPVVDISGVADAPAASAVVAGQVGTSRLKALGELASVLGCYPPFFNNDGAHRLKPSPPAGSPAELTYASGGRVIANTLRFTSSDYLAPNRYQVVSSAPSGSVTGIYDLPATSPHSYAVTGDRVVQSRDTSGIPTTDLANLAAYIDALTDRTSYRKVAWSSTVDPRHDGYQIVSVYGEVFAEQTWDIQCTNGGVMAHTGIGFYG